MSDPYGATPPPEPDEPQPPVPPSSGEPARPEGAPPPAPPYGQPSQPPYGQPSQPPYGQPSQPPYGQPAANPQYGQPGPPQYGQYGGMPSAPPATPYESAGYGAPLRVGDALRFAWAKWKANWGTWLLFALLLAVINVLFNANRANQTSQQIQDAFEGNAAVATGVTFGATVLSLVGVIVSAAVQALGVHAALREADGARPSFGQFFRAPRVGSAVLTSIIVDVAIFLAALVTIFLLGLGGLVVFVFTVFAVPFVIDRARPVFGAIGESFTLVGRNFGPVVLLLLALLGINILGAIPFGLGLLITVPLSVLAIAYAFRRLTGGTII